MDDGPVTDARPTDPDAGGLEADQDDGAYQRRRRVYEVWIVLGLSLGQAAVYSVISLTAKLTAGKPLAQQKSTLVSPASPRPYLDLTYQIADVFFTIMPVLLALWLLSERGRSGAARIGLDFRRPWADLGVGALLAAVVGIPGIGLYLLGHALGITTTVVPAALNAHWWTVPILLLQAAKNAVLEEVVAVGYLMTRLRQLGWTPVATVLASALLRGSYHLYQGFGPFIGNMIMGLLFAEWFRRRGRIMPLVVAHTLLDSVAFVGYQLFNSVLGLH
jgi:membrane protease YdiL (CAAX protease family)